MTRIFVSKNYLRLEDAADRCIAAGEAKSLLRFFGWPEKAIRRYSDKPVGDRREILRNVASSLPPSRLEEFLDAFPATRGDIHPQR